MVLHGKRRPGPVLSREQSLSARPVLHLLVKAERTEKGAVVLQVPRRDTALVRTVSRVFGLPPHRKVALDELGTFVIELCDGKHRVREIVDGLAGRFRLSHREAEVSVVAFLRGLARRSIVALAIGDAGPEASPSDRERHPTQEGDGGGEA